MTATNDRIRGLIFDCDGTLADSMPLHWRAWQRVARRHGFQFAEERFHALAGVPSRDIVRRLNREQGLSLDPIAVAKDKEVEYLPLIPQIEPISAVVAIARENRGRRRMAVASSGTRHVTERVLEHLGLRGWFAAVVTTEDVVRPKPAPDIFLEAARRMGVPPRHCRAFEDTDLGLEAIRAAGMEAVDVRPMLSGPAFR